MVPYIPERAKIFHMLPDLVENLRFLIASQYAEADRAIGGRGNFILRLSHQKHRLSVGDWKALSQLTAAASQARCVLVGMRRRVAGTQQSTSTDGSLTVLNRPDAGKKLGSRRRPRADRTTTQNKKQKLINLSSCDMLSCTVVCRA